MLNDDFKLVAKRNKEIDLVMREMEEVSWRAAGMFNQHEKQYLEDITFFDRGLDYFDNAFLDIDKKSFSEFFDTANSYDNRMTLLENWLCRKDEEIKKRVNLPTVNNAKSDYEINSRIDAPMKKAREAIVGRML